MIKIDRAAISKIQESLREACLTATSQSGLELAFPHAGLHPEVYQIAAMLALQSLMCAAYGPDEIAIPSDVTHFDSHYVRESENI